MNKPVKKVEVVAMVGRKDRPTFHPKYGGLYRGRMVTVDEAILKDSKIFVTKDDYAKHKEAVTRADDKATKKSSRIPARAQIKSKEVTPNAG